VIDLNWKGPNPRNIFIVLFVRPQTFNCIFFPYRRVPEVPPRFFLFCALATMPIFNVHRVNGLLMP